MIDVSGTFWKRLSDDAEIKSMVGSNVYRELSTESDWPLIDIESWQEYDDSLDPAPLQRFTVIVTIETLDKELTIKVRNRVMELLNRSYWSYNGTCIESVLFSSEGRGNNIQGGGDKSHIYYYRELTFNVLAYENSNKGI